MLMKHRPLARAWASFVTVVFNIRNSRLRSAPILGKCHNLFTRLHLPGTDCHDCRRVDTLMAWDQWRSYFAGVSGSVAAEGRIK
jgi:hypothetical protein